MCDAATNKVFLLSARMDLVRTISVPFCSTVDLPLRPAVGAGQVRVRPRTADKKSATQQAGALKSERVPASTTGMDYLEYLSQSVASNITFTDRLGLAPFYIQSL